jgi:hypothetical protein
MLIAAGRERQARRHRGGTNEIERVLRDRRSILIGAADRSNFYRADVVRSLEIAAHSFVSAAIG